MDRIEQLTERTEYLRSSIEGCADNLTCLMDLYVQHIYVLQELLTLL